MSILSFIFGDANAKYLKNLEPIIKQINELEEGFKKLSPEELKAKTIEFKERLAKGEGLDDILPEAFAAVREASRRAIGQRHFDVQLVGGVVLHQGKIAEMKTGEGKTLVATLPLYLNALEGKGAHLITVNDYLARRDVNWMGPIFHALGLSIACVNHDVSYIFYPKSAADKNEVTIEMENLRPISRQAAYGADILYGTNNEFGFDYLRDNMVWDKKQMAQRPLNYAIVDEVDNILIDEARTPLIISSPDEESAKLYERFSGFIPMLMEDKDYIIDHKMRSAALTEEGIDKVEKELGVGNIYQEGKISYVHHLEQALKAETLFKRDKDYVVKNGEVIIVDDFTGRLMAGRRYSGGLHQAIEAKEGVAVQKESKTMATITFQNYFRLYKKLSGMTGTAASSAEEFHKVYKLDVIIIPTNKKTIRVDLEDQVYKTGDGKYRAVIREIKNRHEKGQPSLVGTIAIEKSEVLSAMLAREGLPHEVLNAKNHEREALIIANAGQKGAITIATNMAGRGTDIKLGAGVAELGGLHIIGTERHEARRIDDQLRGRAGRQGDSGSSQFFVSLEDELMRILGAERIKSLMTTLGVDEDQPIENGIISRSIGMAQEKIEGHNFDLRKHILDYDDVMNKHREIIYSLRRKFLNEDDKSIIKKEILKILDLEIKKIIAYHTNGSPSAWNSGEIFEAINLIFSLELEAKEKIEEISKSYSDNENMRKEINDYFSDLLIKYYNKRESEAGLDAMRQIERMVALRTIDIIWVDHLVLMEHLRDSVGLRGYGQKDPLVEYKKEGHLMFRKLLAAINSEISNTVFKVSIAPQAPKPMPIILGPQGGQPGPFISPQSNFGNAAKPISEKIIAPSGVGRNDPCPCGSGKKFKKCHGK
ncbi:preprotein translocase subunit SecA [Patescibacteria group bacterium]|nr:preprotein translocase subunit SecA [Patescibacteria group bacterium]